MARKPEAGGEDLSALDDNLAALEKSFGGPSGETTDRRAGAKIATDSHPVEARGYDAFYERFDTPLMRQHRREAYGQDIGQHSWVTAQELVRDIPRLRLEPESRVLDLGCGPGGPLTFIVDRAGCRAAGIDLSEAAVASAISRAESLGLSGRIDFRVADLNGALPFEARSFQAAISIDVVLHLRDRAAAFREVARVLSPGGRLLFTDAGVVSGAITASEVRRRSVHGFTQFVAPGFNERSLQLAGFRLVESADRTPGLEDCARARLASRIAHQGELEAVEGRAAFESQLRYLEVVVALSERGALSRMMYLAELNSL
ncbi:MAG: SAM-dependent methyltransferase [Thermoanaerobaculia bacterium]